MVFIVFLFIFYDNAPRPHFWNAPMSGPSVHAGLVSVQRRDEVPPSGLFKHGCVFCHASVQPARRHRRSLIVLWLLFFVLFTIIWWNLFTPCHISYPLVVRAGSRGALTPAAVSTRRIWAIATQPLNTSRALKPDFSILSMDGIKSSSHQSVQRPQSGHRRRTGTKALKLCDSMMRKATEK